MCLQEIRGFYYDTISSCSEERDQYAAIVISDHLNIEHIVAFNLAHVQDGTEETYDICWQFLWCLEKHLPRPTTLTRAISNIVENSSTWKLKASCLSNLGALYETLSQLVEASQAFQAAEALYLTAGDPESMGNCLITRADALRAQGRFIQSQNLLEDLQHSDSWESLSETTKARAWCYLDIARMHTFTASADELFVKSMEDHVWGLRSKIRHWQARLYHGGDAGQVHTHLEDLFLQSTSTGDLIDRRDALERLAEMEFCEGRLSNTMNNLQTTVEMSMGQDSERVLFYTVRKAVVASMQGNYDLARELIQNASETFPFFALRNARVFLTRSYSSACVELTAGDCDRAETYFMTVIEACDMQSNLLLKALSIRGLGEIEFARRNFALATQRFEETRSLCTEMGVPPQHVYSCLPFYTLPNKFKGWSLFLEGLSPFTNDTT
jgi:tetratricopeptide (TPR) repeat protein